MNQIRVTKEFRFEAAHALKGYDGPCRNIHGHSYELSGTVTGTPVTDRQSTKQGMVVDFGDLKKLVKKQPVSTGFSFQPAIYCQNNCETTLFFRAFAKPLLKVP